MKEELNEEDINSLFSTVKLRFSYYYKFVFFYIGIKDDYKIEAGFGGCSEDIYRHDVSYDSTAHLGLLEDFKDEWNCVTITKNDKIVFKYFN